MIGIYEIKNLTNDKRYIGQSLNVERRLIEHRVSLNFRTHHNEHLQTSWNLHGENNFVFNLIEEVDPLLLDDREKHWIAFYKSYDRKFGYNKTHGGQFGKLNEDSIKKIKEALKGKPTHMKGKLMSAKQKEKIRQSLMGRKFSDERKKKISDSLKGKQAWNIGKRNLTEMQVAEILKRLEAGERAGILAKEYSVANSTITRIKQGKYYDRNSVT